MISRVMVVLCVKDDALVLTHVSDFAPSFVTVILSTNFKSFVRRLEMDLPISEKYVAIMSSSCESAGCHDDGAFLQRARARSKEENGEI